MVINVLRSSCRVSFILADFNDSRIFSTDLRKNAQISIFAVNRILEAESFHEDGKENRRTDRQT